VLPPWFWAWIVIAVACAAYELTDADMLSLPFALGALTAAVVEIVGAPLAWQWGTFFGVSLAALIGFGRWWKSPSRRPEAPPPEAL
jgi:membrane protein implicated in regulation of membrane protease activity